MDPDAAWRELVHALSGRLGEARLERDELDGALVFVRRDMLHLDADALNDRLAAWTARELRHRVPHASAFVSFRHARPATYDDATLDLQEAWHDLEPTMRLELDVPRATLEEVRRFAEMVGAFLALVEAEGRPAGWRVVDEGNAE